MTIARSVRFASINASVVAESRHVANADGSHVLVSTRLNIPEVSRPSASLCLLDGSGNVVESANLAPDLQNGLQLGLHAFSTKKLKDFRVQLVNTSGGGTATGYYTVVHPVTPETLATLQSTREAPLTVPEQFRRPDPPKPVGTVREIAPMAADGELVCEVPAGNRDIEPIFFRGNCTSNFASGVCPARNSESIAISR